MSTIAGSKERSGEEEAESSSAGICCEIVPAVYIYASSVAPSRYLAPEGVQNVRCCLSLTSSSVCACSATEYIVQEGLADVVSGHDDKHPQHPQEKTGTADEPVVTLEAIRAQFLTSIWEVCMPASRWNDIQIIIRSACCCPPLSKTKTGRGVYLDRLSFRIRGVMAVCGWTVESMIS